MNSKSKMNKNSSKKLSKREKRAKKEQPEETKVDLPNLDDAMDLALATRGCWLVKVPKYVAEKWEKAPSDMTVAKIRIVKPHSKLHEVSMTLTPSCLTIDPENKIPSHHVLDVKPQVNQTLGIFSQTSEERARTSKASDNEKGQRMEGAVVQKMECRPTIADAAYMKYKFKTISKAAEPKRCVKPLDKIVNNYKPVSRHANETEYNNRKKDEGKRFRADKDQVLKVLFEAFEKHQYYNIRDLSNLTKQPPDYLKEILREHCRYNTTHPHKFTWELKPEYRHYAAASK